MYVGHDELISFAELFVLPATKDMHAKWKETSFCHMHSTLNWDWNAKSFCERKWSGGYYCYYWLLISSVNHPTMSNRLQTFGLGWTWYVLLQFPSAFFHGFAFEVECFTCSEHTLIRSFLEVFHCCHHLTIMYGDLMLIKLATHLPLTTKLKESIVPPYMANVFWRYQFSLSRPSAEI